MPIDEAARQAAEGAASGRASAGAADIVDPARSSGGGRRDASDCSRSVLPALLSAASTRHSAHKTLSEYTRLLQWHPP